MKVLVIFAMCCVAGFAWAQNGPRQTISLDGAWEIAEGAMDVPPKTFAHKVPVPGLVDMAEPTFANVGEKDQPREAFWYRKTFRVDGPIPDVAMLKISKVQYNALVFLNGQEVGRHASICTPAELLVTKALKGNGAENELVVRVGAYLTAIPPEFPDGFDNEKVRYIPGIYDSVSLILTGKPFISNVQVAPNLAKNEARVVVELQGSSPGAPVA